MLGGFQALDAIRRILAGFACTLRPAQPRYPNRIGMTLSKIETTDPRMYMISSGTDGCHPLECIIPQLVVVVKALLPGVVSPKVPNRETTNYQT